jgi:large subunit ribosomal protein L25
MSNQKVKLAAVTRTATGKGGARRCRREGLVPGIVYSGGKEATAVAVKPLDLTRALTGPWRRNALIELELEGSTRVVMVKELQKHPLRRTADHIDFVEVDEATPREIKVPFAVTGRSAAVKAGGKIHTPRRYLRVKCAPSAIPVSIDLDSTSLDWGAHRASIVDVPEGVELLDDQHLTVLTISRPRGTAAETDEAATEAAAPAAEG